MTPQTGAPRRGSVLALLAFASLTAVTAYIGVRAAHQGKDPWYRILRKPKVTPAAEMFRPVWTGLFALTALSGYRVWSQPPSPERSRALVLWGTQLALNATWCRLFFGHHKTKLALADLVALWATLGAYMMQSRYVDRTASKLMAPYLGWVTFAGYLNEEVVRKNPRLLN
jgi:translocator protein